MYQGGDKGILKMAKHQLLLLRSVTVSFMKIKVQIGLAGSEISEEYITL